MLHCWTEGVVQFCTNIDFALQPGIPHSTFNDLDLNFLDEFENKFDFTTSSS